MWFLPDDTTEPIINAKEQINRTHLGCHVRLPETAIVFFMSKGIEHLCDNYNARKLPGLFPRFLNRCPIWEIMDYQVCFLDGGRGAPQACDTVETLAAFGVNNIISVGLFGAFDQRINIGEIITPEKAFVEEGTSLHYYESIEYAAPDDHLLKIATTLLNVKTYPIVSTDAVYRQTFHKEAMWRRKGAVGVDMETSAVFNIARYLGLKSVGLLMASDIHPMNPGDQKWKWHMTDGMRFDLSEKSIAIARQLRKPFAES